MPAQTFKLNNGMVIPAVGLGTWKSSKGEVAAAVAHAIRSGYKLIDTAYGYKNEPEVGQGIRDSGVARKDIFITSKLAGVFHRCPEEGLDLSLKALGIDSLDLYLMHWPIPLLLNGTDPDIPTNPDGSRSLDLEWSFVKTWKMMEKLLDTGKVKAIGVSNCSQPFLEELLKEATVVPAVDQVELHPYNPELNLHEFCKQKGILLQGYSPLGSGPGRLLADENVVRLAKKYNVEPATLLISWQVVRGIPTVPKSVTPARIESNLKLIDISPEDVAEISRISPKDGKRRFVVPNWGVDLKWDYPQ